MTAATDLPHPAVRAVYGLLALAVGAGWLVAAALPAQAALAWGVESPGAGSVVEGSFTITAYVESFQDESVDAVRSRFRRGDQPVGDVRNMQRQGESSDARRPGVRRSTWTTEASVGSMPNGRYVVEVSVVNGVYPDGSPWQGHEVVIDSPPTAHLETVRVANADRREVEVRWVRSTAPDHVRYVLQRAAGGDFADVRTFPTSDTTSYVDTVPDYGEYRYRVKAVRMAADGSEREAVSDPRSVNVQPTSSERPENEDGEPDGPLGNRGENPDPASPAPSDSGASAPRLSTSSPGGGGGGGGNTSGRANSPSVQPPANANNTFEEYLDYGVPPPEWEEAEDEDDSDVVAGAEDPGTLTVFGDGGIDRERVLVPVAGGLVLTLFGLHIVRFLNPGA